MSNNLPAEVTRVLMALGQALATANLYSGEHPAREKATDVFYNELRALLEETPHPRFSFLGDEVIFGRMAVRALRDWSLGPRLSKAGIQWLEFEDSVTREDIRGFIADAAAILAAPSGVPIDPLLFQRSGIRWGMVSVGGTSSRVAEGSGEYRAVHGSGWAAEAEGVDEAGDAGGAGGGTRGDTPGSESGFAEEAEATRWIATSLDSGKSIPLAEAQGVVRALAVALHQDRDVLHPLYRIGSAPDAATHSMGVSILAMSLAERLGMLANEVRAIGVAALLHDVGLSRVPKEILAKTTALSRDEVVEYQKHTEHGARMLLSSQDDLALAAVVAYEHHWCPDGSGYPALRHKRQPDKVSLMVSICASYHARRSQMSFRPALDGRAVIDHMEWYAGTRYDSELCVAFLAMLREAEDRAQATAGHSA
jgi:putative nucleotidyltransferase with HDIG domain